MTSSNFDTQQHEAQETATKPQVYIQQQQGDGPTQKVWSVGVGRQPVDLTDRERSIEQQRAQSRQL